MTVSNALILLLSAMLTVAPFVPMSNIVSNFGVADIFVVLAFVVIAFRERSIPWVALVPAIVGLIGLLSVVSNYGNYANQSEVFGAIIHVARWFYFTAAIAVFAFIGRTPDRLALVLKGIVVGALITGVWAWWVWVFSPQYYRFVPMLHVIRDSDWIINRNYVGFFLAVGFCVAFPLSFSRNKVMWFWLACSIALGVSAFLTMSKGTWLAMLVPLLVLGIHKLITGLVSGWISIRLVGAILISCLMATVGIGTILVHEGVEISAFGAVANRISESGRTNGDRVQFAQDAFVLSVQNPLLGVGPKGYKAAANQAGMMPTADPHNALLWVSAEMGGFALIIMIGFLALLVFWYGSLLRGKNLSSEDRAEILMFLALLVNIPLHGLPFSMKHLWILVGLRIGARAYGQLPLFRNKALGYSRGKNIDKEEKRT